MKEIEKIKELAKRLVDLAEEMEEAAKGDTTKKDAEQSKKPKFTILFKEKQDGSVHLHDEKETGVLFDAPPGREDEVRWISTGLTYEGYGDNLANWANLAIKCLLDKKAQSMSIRDRVLQIVALVDALWYHAPAFEFIDLLMHVTCGEYDNQTMIDFLKKYYITNWYKRKEGKA